MPRRNAGSSRKPSGSPLDDVPDAGEPRLARDALELLADGRGPEIHPADHAGD